MIKLLLVYWVTFMGSLVLGYLLAALKREDVLNGVASVKKIFNRKGGVVSPSLKVKEKELLEGIENE